MTADSNALEEYDYYEDVEQVNWLIYNSYLKTKFQTFI